MMRQLWQARSIGLAWHLSIVVVVAPTAWAQTSIEIGEPPSCSQCGLELVQVAELGNEYGEPGGQGTLITLARTSRGEFLAAYSETPFEIVVHDSSGLVVRKIGRRGQGPGEFRRIVKIVVTPGDTINVADRGNARISVLSPSGTLVRSVSMPQFAYDFLPLSNGRMLVNANVPSVDRAGLPLHLVAADGTIGSSFGAETAVFRPDLTHLLMRSLSTQSAASIWVAYRTEYRIEEWSRDLNRKRVIVRNADWFRPYLQITSVSPDSPPQPHLIAAQPDGRGRLWTLSRVPDREWRRGIAKTMSEGREIYRIVDPGLALDGMLELLDLTSGKVVASRRVNALLGDFIDAEHVVAVSNDGPVRRNRVYRVRLVQPKGESR